MDTYKLSFRRGKDAVFSKFQLISIRWKFVFSFPRFFRYRLFNSETQSVGALGTLGGIGGMRKKEKIGERC